MWKPSKGSIMAFAYMVASIPPILLLVYVWYLDRKEHEPVGLISKLFLVSALLGTAAAAFIESVGGAMMELTFVSYVPVVGDLLYYFVVVALVEEFCKRAPVMLFAWNNQEFDYRFDVVVYCVATAIGFAVAENIMYISVFGSDVMVGRLIPVHTICGVFMGYYLGCAKICERGGNAQACKRYRVKSLLIPTIIHGTWDFCVSSGLVLLNLFALAGVIVLSVYAFKRLHQYARHDAPL